MQNTLLIRRSIFSIWRWIKYPAPFALACITFIAFIAATGAFPLPVIAIISIALVSISAVLLIAGVRDWRNERYDVDENGVLHIFYKTGWRYSSSREGHISKLQDVYIVRRGFSEHLFDYGDVYLQVSWSKEPFVMRDVNKPKKVKNTLRELAEYYKSDDSTLDVLDYLEDNIEM
jgi:hypothetical protein